MHPMLLPKVSFLDPTNTYTVSSYQTACGAADIMSHINIDDSNFSIMSKKACMDGVLPGFKPLNAQDIENIFKMCL